MNLAAFPYGCHVCEVEVDPETGVVQIARYTAVDDVGRAVNPMIVHGQVHGGITHGIGQALLEQCWYDPQSGQLLSGSLMDYAIAHADDVPTYVTELSEVPSPTHPLGHPSGGRGRHDAGARCRGQRDRRCVGGVRRDAYRDAGDAGTRVARHPRAIDRKTQCRPGIIARTPIPSCRRRCSTQRIRCAAACRTGYCDPKIAADLFHECLDEHLLCDDLGVNIVSIEHHSGINSLYGASPMILGNIARQTSKVRILSQGTLITVRRDPVRIAEEYATADVISRGRLEIGFVKSGDSEMVSGNANPIGIVERFWEAIDLIMKTLTSHDGPFSWEGKHFTHRHVNIWPPLLSASASAALGGDRRSGDVGRTRPARHGQCAGAARHGRHEARLGGVSPGARGSRTAAAGAGSLRLYGVRLCRRHGRGRRARRQQTAVVPQHAPEAGAAVFEIPARAHAAGDGAAHVAHRAAGAARGPPMR